MLTYFIERLSEIFSTVWGWILCLLLALLDHIAGYSVMVNIAVAAVVMDAVWGITSSIKQGRFALSELARDTLAKLAVYGCAILAFIGIDTLLGSDSGITTSIVCVSIVLVELWSTCASMIICFPQLPFLRLLRHALVGEIARKLSINPEDVETALLSSQHNENH